MALDLPDPYAEVTDLETYWGRTLTQSEKDRATVLLGWAAQIINEQPGSDDFDPLVCAQVSMDMVKRAMLNGDGVSSSSTQQAMADMSATVTNRYVNPVGNLYLTAQEADRLAGRSGPAAFSVALASSTRVPSWPWSRQNSSQTDDSQP
ncbi:phage Gp19/Gp15/Gp42 family protein [Mycolicibacterium fortuitum]|uniref:Gp19/Gp15/Gp42 family protein n=1 Tax=Mycolicibacterium fortuitum TaxID=1766 RepID=UPI0022BA6990|nr:Gp19/Gp15/Gp42 family protein [Mycolicibacterium fortuitum]WAY18402.1 phage Gp19/Gp15/Gp42 family protein [Mycolicibacterium fortuitum]